MRGFAVRSTEPSDGLRHRRSRRRGEGGEGGAAALAIPVAAVLVVTASLALGDLGSFMVARARAQTAADAAALAAAVEIALGGPAAPVEQARRLAATNGARLLACHCPSSAVPPGRRRARPRASPWAPPSRGAPTSRTILVEVDIPLTARLLPGRVRIPASARADVRART